MNIEQLIKSLKESNLYAECPLCDEEFKISESVLFDGTKPFPPNALEVQKNLIGEMQQLENELKKRIKLATEKSKITAKAVNIGKNLEKILPVMKDFKWSLSDSRFLGDPIDLITFNGVSIGKVSSISFIEVKSGGARLNEHQKSIKDAIEDRKVSYKVFL
jgi:predicted Holliday junction resolvase-like endonuclease